MKIIKHGKPQSSQDIMEGKCYICGCEFECEKSESKWIESHNPTYEHYAIKCPDCGRSVQLRQKS